MKTEDRIKIHELLSNKLVGLWIHTNIVMSLLIPCRSPHWRAVSELERKEMQVKFAEDGEFWMAFKDFLTYFHRLEVCHLGPSSLAADLLGGI